MRNNIVLSTVLEAPKFEGPKIPKLGKALEAKKYIEGWTPPKTGVRLFDISMGWGMLGYESGANSHIDVHPELEKIVKRRERPFLR